MKKKPFHAPFEELAGRARELRRQAPAPKPAAPPAPPPPRPPTEAELWARATAGATPVLAGPDLVPPPAPRSPKGRARLADLEVVDTLRAPGGDPPRFDLASGDSRLEGSVAGLDAGLVRGLKRGDFPVEARLDLHGLTRDEARGAVERFLRQERLGGRRCVLLVHGRGRHSESQLPVLKEALHGWLAAGEFGRSVLAFASARPADGGGGALYVLLRRAGR